MSLNSFELNSQALNGPETLGVIATGSGQIVSIEQTVAHVSSGLIVSIEQEQELRITGSGQIASIEQSVKQIASGQIVQIAQLVYNAATADNVTLFGWDLILRIGGYDYSEKMWGMCTITREEGSAALANFTLIPDAGVQDLTAWQGKSVTIDVRESTGITRIYTGVVDIPEVDLINKRITFRCTDRRTEQINNQLGTYVKNVGYFSSKVFSTIEDTADELQKRLTTVPQSLDFDAYGNYHLTDWAPKATPDYTLDDTNVFYRDPELEIVRRGKLVNKINLELEYRYTRLHQRTLTWSWTHPAQIDECNFLLNGQTQTSRAMVRSAVDASGWRLTSAGINFTDILEAGWYNCGQPGDGVSGYIAWSPISASSKTVAVTNEAGEQITDSSGNPVYETQLASLTDYSKMYCEGAGWNATKRWSQTIQEKYALTITAPQSVSQYGAVERDEAFGVEDPYDPSNWDSNQSNDTSGTYYTNQNGNLGDFNTAFECVVNRAKTTILRGHRQNYTRIYRSLWPEIDLKHTVEVNTASNPGSGSAGFNTVGKVVRIEHSFDISDKREALTRLETASYTSQGSTTPTTITPPSRPSDSAPTSFGVIYLQSHFGEDPTNGANWTGMIGNQIVDGRMTNYPVSFVVDAPAIESAVRDARVLDQTGTYNIEIPNNTFTVTF